MTDNEKTEFQKGYDEGIKSTYLYQKGYSDGFDTGLGIRHVAKCEAYEEAAKVADVIANDDGNSTEIQVGAQRAAIEIRHLKHETLP